MMASKKPEVPSVAPYSSTKLLWQLVTEQSLQVTDDVLSNELKANLNLLVEGLGFYKPPTRASRENYMKKRGAASSSKLNQFILKLSDLLQVEEEVTKQILSAYLSGEFRGTKQSLKELINEERSQPALLVDIWQFYRAERLYLLQVIKEIISQGQDEKQPHFNQFQDLLELLSERDIKTRILQQLRVVVKSELPGKDSHGNHFSTHCLNLWIQFNLKEQSQLLQINLLLLHAFELDNADANMFTKHFQLYMDHNFGHRQNARHLHENVSKLLLQSIGHLETLTMIYLMDLPNLTVNKGASHWLWQSEETVTQIDKLISGLGNISEHGPIMLAWMLAHFVVDGQDALLSYQVLGERAIGLGALKFLCAVATNEVILSNLSLAGLSKGICYSLLSVLVSAFDPQRMGILQDAQTLSEELLKEDNLAQDFWKQGLDVGLGTHFQSLLSSFPVEIRPVCKIATSLASTSAQSAEMVLTLLQNLTEFAEPIDMVPSYQTQLLEAEKWQLLTQRYPNPTMKQISLQPGTIGLTGDRSHFKWQYEFSAWNYLLNEVDVVIQQMSFGARRIQQNNMKSIVDILNLFHSVMDSSQSAITMLGPCLTDKLLTLVEKCGHTPQPPLIILSNCLKCLGILSVENSSNIWSKLSEMKIFPYFTKTSLCQMNEIGNDLNTGVVGSLLAQQECVDGEYPLLFAYLDLLSTCVNIEDESLEPSLSASITFLAQDVLPSFQQWTYVNTAGREKLGQKILSLFKDFLSSNTTNTLKKNLASAIIQGTSVETVLEVVGIGDRAIQQLIESQHSWESGTGTELGNLINLAMSVLQQLLLNTEPHKLDRLSQTFCSPVSASRPHFVLTLAQYIYHVHNLCIPISAMKLMATIANIFPMSLLACIGRDSEAVKDVLIYRLESPIESVALKTSIIDLFSSCVETQPGFIQLLIGILDNAEVVRGQGQVKEPSENGGKDHGAAKLVSDDGCLKAILSLVEETKNRTDPKLLPLQNSLTRFLFKLWLHQRIIAISYLKGQKDFWTNITWTLFHEDLKANEKLSSQLLRIISSEIFAFASKVDTKLQTILDRLCDPKQKYFENWINHVLNNEVLKSAEKDTKAVVSKEDLFAGDDISLLGSWKSFLIVLAKDQPVTLSPGQCHMIASNLISRLRELLKSDVVDESHRSITSISELCLVLIQKWQTKCSDNMKIWCQNQALLLEDFSASFPSLNLRSQMAVIAIANTVLKTSHFKLNKDESVLHQWIEPTGHVLLQSLKQCGQQQASEEYMKASILAINLLRNLLQRIENSNVWYDILHRNLILQSLISTLHHCLRERKCPDLIFSALGFCLFLAKSDRGCKALLSSDLSQMIWLPLSNLTQPSSDWKPVFHMSLQLVIFLLRKGKYDSLETAISFVALLQDQMTSFLLAPRNLVVKDHLELTVASATLIGLLMTYRKQWLMHHSSSLIQFYHSMNSLLHISACFLLRPSLLSLVISRNQMSQPEHVRQEADKEIERVRRMSSTDQEIELSTPEISSVQNLFLDAIMACLTMQRHLSPNLVDLVTGNVVDIDNYEVLLQIGFSSPAFEQENGVTYGTLISIANSCIRAITRGDRDSSPASQRRSGAMSPLPLSSTTSSTSSRDTKSSFMDKKRLLMVLEQSLFVMLCQALLILAITDGQSRDAQLLKRELGTEFSSCIESMRRYVHRGTKSPQTVLSSSPGSTPLTPRLAKSDEQIMKVFSTIVQNVFK